MGIVWECSHSGFGSVGDYFCGSNIRVVIR
jgi:hypothetical protein